MKDYGISVLTQYQPVAATLYQIVKDNVVRREEAKAANTIENND